MKGILKKFPFAICFMAISIPITSSHLFKTMEQRQNNIDKFTASMDEVGYEVRIGSMTVFSKETCDLPENAFYCKGNNPNSPYAAYNFPIIPNQTFQKWEGRFREDEAVVQFGVTPPLAEYFGFTFYLNSVEYRFGDSTGGYSGGHLALIPPDDNRTHIQASLEDPINPANMNVTSNGTYYDSFDKDFVLIATSDEYMFNLIKNSFVAMGVPSNIFNLHTWSNEVINLGIEDECDTLGMLLRTAFFRDHDERDVYLKNIPISVLRITPKIERSAFMPFSRPQRKPRSIGSSNQSYLRNAYIELGRAVKRTLSGINILESRSLAIDADPDVCIDERTKCFFENTDAAYFGNLPGHFFPDNGHFIVIGVNHAEARYARYSSVTLYDAATLIAVGSFTNLNDMKGSADRYLPDNPYKDQLYAISFRRNCTGLEYCIDVTTNDLGRLSAMVFMSRAYVDPNGTKGSDPALMLPFRVLYGEDPSLIPSLWKSGASGAYKRLRSVLFPDDSSKANNNDYVWPMA